MRLLLALAALLLAEAVSAQTAAVTVRGGEHAGFTRLALILPAPGNWRFGRTPAGYALRLDRAEAVFDLSAVFRTIRRDRIASLWADPVRGGLVIGVGCACHAVAFAARPGVIVIDVRDGPPPPDSGFETAIDGVSAGILPPLGERAVLRPQPRPPTLAGAPAPPPPAPRAPLSLPALDTSAAAAARLRLAIARQIAEAAARGLVDPAVVLPSETAGTPSVPRRGAAAPLPPAASGNLRIDEDGGPPVLAADGRACLADGVIALGDPATPPSVSDLAAARRRVLGEFDRPDPEAAVALARTYLALGFGAEAGSVLAAFAPADPRRAPLAAVAAIIDGDGGGAFAGQAACAAAVAMWAVLDEPAPRRGEPVAVEAVARTYAALPPGLRRELGPRLAGRLLAAGRPEAAQAIRAALARVVAEGDAALALIDADLSRAAGAPQAAEAALAAVVAGDGPLAGAALARLSDSVVERGGTLDPPALVALSAAAREQEGTPDGAELGRAEARALAAAGDFAAAFTAARDDAAQRDIWSLLAARGDAAALLAHAARPPAAPALPPATQATMADRLLALGLPELARAWLPAEPAAAADRVRVARAAVQMRDGREALRLLAGVAGAEAALIRGEAAVLLGQAALAAEAFAEAGAPTRAAAARVRLAGWTAAAAGEPVPLPPGADVLLAAAAPAAASPAPAPTLAATRAAVGGSAAVRSAIGALLQAVPPPQD